MKEEFKITRSLTFIMLGVLFFSACSRNDNSPDPFDNECEGENLYGPAGGMIEITDTDSDLFFGQWAGFMPFLSDVDFFISLERVIAISFIENQKCDYSCVTSVNGFGIYTTYALHHVYMVTKYMVTLAIDGDFWVSCP